MPPTAAVDKLVRSVLGIMEQKISAAAEVDDILVHPDSVFDVRTENDRFSAAGKSIAISAARMLVFSSDYHCMGEKANVFIGHDELKAGSHVRQLHGEVLALHGNRKNPFQVVDRTITTECEQRDLAAFDVGGFKKGKSLDVVPMKMRKGNHDRFMPKDGILHDMTSEVPYSRPGIDDPDIHGVIGSDEDATRTSTVLVELSSADRNRPPAAVDCHCDLVGAVPYWPLRIFHVSKIITQGAGDNPGRY